MKMKTHSVYIRMMSLLLAVLCIVGLFPASALAASPNTIKLEDCTYNGVHYDSPALGICYMTIEICHHNFHCGVVDFFGAVPLMTFQRPAHAFAFFGAKAHDA